MIEFTKRPLALAISKETPAILSDGTSATAEPNPAIANSVERTVVSKKYTK